MKNAVFCINFYGVVIIFVSLHKNIRYEAYIIYLVLYVGIQLF